MGMGYGIIEEGLPLRDGYTNAQEFIILSLRNGWKTICRWDISNDYDSLLRRLHCFPRRLMATCSFELIIER